MDAANMATFSRNFTMKGVVGRGKIKSRKGFS